MAEDAPALPSCIGCTYDDRGYPCRNADGTLNFTRIAAAMLAQGRLYAGGEPDDAALEPYRWASDCEFDIEQDHPELLLCLVVAAMDVCVTSRDAAFIAAGPVETAVVKHGPVLIDRLEALAERSAKVRYFLSAIWGETRADPSVWARIAKAAGSEGRMDTDGRTPSTGEPVTVLDEAAATQLMTERVVPLARQLGLNVT
jgi:hypothetical protein